ncbi:T9SS type A sorting domain-containing protein [Flavobacterium amnicola]|uniref:T9SS type A sorting domain-containing protein n=1 Tax=Flavobacterium amnicola TaxID=2506422 RepID=A0A4Q1K6V7_9FLAO|nr:T9SS type A sorting domain-containing protein [Flavobacterium amnicola]RXR21195.1 T9SS type A sorting domain-containing protein [Flavobacterium amnicola]
MKKILFSFLAFIHLSVLGQNGSSVTYSGSTTLGAQNGNISIARYNTPTCIAKDGLNNIYVSDFNGIRKIDETGNVTTIIPYSSIGPVSDMAYDTTTGTFIVAATPSSVKLLRIDTNGNILNTYYDNGLTTSSAGGAFGVVVDNSGAVYYSIPTFHIIRKLVPSTNTTTIYAGQFNSSGNVIGAIAGSQFNLPQDLEIDSSGNIYTFDQSNTVIKKITSSTVSNILAINGSKMAIDGNNLYVSKSSSIFNINLSTLSGLTLSGNDTLTGFQNGGSNSSLYNAPAGILIFSPSFILVCDSYNNQIRRVQINDACENAQTLTANSGLVDIGTYNGNVPTGSNLCYNYTNNVPMANWYKFTPTQNGVLDVTSQTIQNSLSNNTRLAVYRGTCGALICLSSNDNISTGTGNLNSYIQGLELVANNTYYIVWDNTYVSSTTNFSYTFTPKTCFTPNTYSLVTPTTQNSIHLQWNAPVNGDSTPDSYTAQIGLRNWGRLSGGLIQSGNPTETNFQFIGLQEGKIYDIYVKTNCSASDESLWEGPLTVATAFAPVTPTYAENFDSETVFSFLGLGRYSDTTNANWKFQTGGPSTFVYNGTNSVFSISDSATLTNAYLYTKPINLVAGQSYNVNFYLNDYLTAGNTTQYQIEVLVGTNPTSTTPSDYNIIWTDFNTQPSNMFVAKNATYTAPTSGVYRFAIRNSSQSTGTGSHYLFVDNLVISSSLSVEDFNKSNLLLYPNPVLDYISIQNPDNISITNYSVLDINGRILHTNTLSNDSLINLSSLTKGIYIIQLETEKGVLTKKIIKK